MSLPVSGSCRVKIVSELYVSSCRCVNEADSESTKTYGGSRAADEDETASLDGLAVDTGQRLGSLVGGNGDLLVGHGYDLCVWLKWCSLER